MADEDDNSRSHQPQGQIKKNEKSSYRQLLVIVIVFAIFWVAVFLTHRRVPINWIRDYQAALELARQQHRPMLLAFYKVNTPMSTDAFNNTYNDPKVKKYVESNFVPVLIDVEEQPDIARLYNINYYPTHYVRYADDDTLAGPRLGYDPPDLFIEQIQRLLDELNEKTGKRQAHK